MNTLPKYVLTHDKEERTGWANSHPIAVNDVPGLKQKSARPIAVFAGAKAAQALLQQDLIDEVRLIQDPLILGGGTPLFDADGKRRNLRLTASERFESGATMNRYRNGSRQGGGGLRPRSEHLLDPVTGALTGRSCRDVDLSVMNDRPGAMPPVRERSQRRPLHRSQVESFDLGMHAEVGGAFPSEHDDHAVQHDRGRTGPLRG